MQPLLTPAQVAERLGMKVSTLMNLARSGRIPRHALSGRIIRFCWSDVCKALNLDPEVFQPADSRIAKK